MVRIHKAMLLDGEQQIATPDRKGSNIKQSMSPGCLGSFQSRLRGGRQRARVSKLQRCRAFPGLPTNTLPRPRCNSPDRSIKRDSGVMPRLREDCK